MSCGGCASEEAEGTPARPAEDIEDLGDVRGAHRGRLPLPLPEPLDATTSPHLRHALTRPLPSCVPAPAQVASTPSIA